MTTELDVLGLVSDRLSAHGLPFMLTGSFAQVGATVGCHYAVKRVDAMNDASAAILKVVADRHRSMTPAQRCLAASSLFETARKIVESSLPGGLTLEQRRLAVVRRIYQNELPEAALMAHARYTAATGCGE
jgi:hypothetical protein